MNPHACTRRSPQPAAPTRLQSLQHGLQQFLTPQIWKQAQQARGCRTQASRWRTQPLVLTLLVLTWCTGDSTAERFETAKAFCAVTLPKKRRPGQTVQGFDKALRRLPVGVLRALADGVRHRLALLVELMADGFITFGCDGSRLECPRTPELEKHLGEAGKKDSAPTLWLTVLVHLRSGLLWAWRLGKGTASERAHLRALLFLLAWLPVKALLVADAGFNGFALAQAILQAQASFLIRMSAKVSLYTEERKPLRRFREGLVYYWPQEAQQKGARPLLLRLLRIRGKKPADDVWLLTNVLDRQRLSRPLAGKYYSWRWECEGFFRTYKRVLHKTKLRSRTVRLVHREAEGALLAVQLLLAQGALAMPRQTPGGVPEACSARKVLQAIREEIKRVVPPPRPCYGESLRAARREQRPRSSGKATRAWPRRGPHKPPKPPKLRPLTMKQKARILQLQSADP